MARAQYVLFVFASLMALRLIRRHVKDCPHRSTRYRRCKCPIHVYGTLAGERIRKALDQTSWDAASELITGWTAAGEIGQLKLAAPTIRESVAKYLDDGRARKLGWEAMPSTSIFSRIASCRGVTPRASSACDRFQ
jgi:hypothetical protein